MWPQEQLEGKPLLTQHGCLFLDVKMPAVETESQQFRCGNLIHTEKAQ